MESGFLLPDPDDADAAPFWQGTARGELLVQTCARCGHRRMPPRPMCFVCRSLEDTWQKLSGLGTIWSFVVAHPPLLPAYQQLAPYNVIAVALDDDPRIRLVGNLVARPDGAINEIDPSTIHIGDAVRVVFQAVDDIFLPRWMRP
jgi:uncharacterized OB-fold protein